MQEEIEVIVHDAGIIISNMRNMTSLQVTTAEFVSIVGSVILQRETGCQPDEVEPSEATLLGQSVLRADVAG